MLKVDSHISNLIVKQWYTMANIELYLLAVLTPSLGLVSKTVPGHDILKMDGHEPYVHRHSMDPSKQFKDWFLKFLTNFFSGI